MEDKELLKLTPGELVDLGICPTCFNRKHNGALYGDNSDKLIYEDKDIECFFVGNPRAHFLLIILYNDKRTLQSRIYTFFWCVYL